jgi:putative nucleotidyltransferase with HDIG domain
MNMSETVLFVDDEENILNALSRVFVDMELDSIFCSSPLKAVEICTGRQVALVVSDNMMPEMYGVELLAKVKEISPLTTRILMTAYADLSTALQAINSGEVFRFIVKPWQEDDLLRSVSEGVARHRIMASLYREDEAVLRSLAQTIELKDLYTRGHCDRVANHALAIADLMGLDDSNKRAIRHGSWLHDCGKIGVPEAILNSTERLTTQEFDTMRHHPEWGALVAEQAMLPGMVINIIRHHHENFDGSGYPDGKAGEAIPVEARIVAVADVFDALTSNRSYRSALQYDEACSILSDLKGTRLDPLLVELFIESLKMSRTPAP